VNSGGDFLAPASHPDFILFKKIFNIEGRVKTLSQGGTKNGKLQINSV
jgi:hypothetical protein